MKSPSSENSQPTPSDLQMAIRELIKGRDLTTELQNLLGNPSENCGSESVNAIAEKILRSFVEALSILNSGETLDVCQNSATARPRSPCSGDRRTKDSGERPKIPAAKDRTGVSKRRRICRMWATLSATPFDDGHVWRKYGQKEILGSKHPRGYFRCTHKSDQGCQATKQVQKSETDPSMYVVKYMGFHTCKNLVKGPQLILDSTPRDPCLLNFEPNLVRKQDNPFISSFTSVKHESMGEMPSNLNQSNSLSLGYLMPFDHMVSDSHVPATNFSLTTSDPGDVASSAYSSASSHTLEMDLMDTVEFDDVFRFDEVGFISSI